MYLHEGFTGKNGLCKGRSDTIKKDCRQRKRAAKRTCSVARKWGLNVYEQGLKKLSPVMEK